MRVMWSQTSDEESKERYEEIDNNYKGSLLDFRAGTEYRASKSVGVGINLSRMSINAEVDDNNFRGSINDVYTGLNVYAAYYF